VPAFIFGRPAFGLHLHEVNAGVPLYLVSACGTAEEFVAAFRRYADRSGLFVPMNEPLVAGRRGRIALALKDGGVMIDGEAEVVASSPRPSGIHARVGMTIKWVEPDEPSKTVIAELEKARLAMKPSAPSVPPRPAEIPAEPRAVPPSPGGRIDAANALAECVLIGDASGFAPSGPSGPVIDESKTGAGKFVIPSIPPTGRSKPTTTPPALTRPRTPSAQVPMTIKPITPPVGVLKPDPEVAPIPATPVGGVPAPKPTPPTGVAMKPGTPASGVPAKPARAPTPPPVVTISAAGDDVAAILTTPSGGVPAPASRAATTLGVSPLTRPAKDDVPARATRIGFPALKLPAMEAPAVIVGAPPSDAEPPAPVSPFTRATPPQPMVAVVPAKPAGPPMPRNPTPFAPLPIVRLPAGAELLDPEKTDLTDVPVPPASDGPRSLGVAIVSAVGPEASEPTRQEPPIDVAAAEAAETIEMPEPVAAARSGGMRASQLMAAISGEDWTMTPDAPAPTLLPKPAAAEAKPAADAEPSGPAGDWTISADPTADDGWTAPAKVEVPPQPAPKGNRVVAIASAEPLNAVEWEDKPTGIGEPLVEIDPSLIASRPPSAPPPPPPPAMGSAPPLVPPPLGPMPPVMAPASSFGPTGPVQPLFVPPPPQGLRASSQVPAYPMFRNPMDSTSVMPARRKRRILIGLVAGAVVLVGGAIAVFAFGGHGDQPTVNPPAHPAPVTPAPAPLAVAPQPAVQPPAGSAVAPMPAVAAIDAGVAIPAHCKVDVASTPYGAEIWLDEVQLGITPTTLDLPCGVAAKLEFRKAKLPSVVRDVTPGTDTSVSVKLAVPAAAMVSMRVTSNPPGATITMGGKVLGITPTTIHLPANGASLTLTKEGYATDVERVVPRPNGAHNVVLKHSTKHH